MPGLPDSLATPRECRIAEPDYDSATVINADIYLRPGNWVNISPGTHLYGVVTGKSYRLTSAAGMLPA